MGRVHRVPVVNSQRMIAVTRAGFGHGVADVAGDRLAGAVVAAVLDRSAEVRHRDAAGVVGHAGRLGYGVRFDPFDARNPPEHRFDCGLLRAAQDRTDVQHCCRAVVRCHQGIRSYATSEPPRCRVDPPVRLAAVTSRREREREIAEVLARHGMGFLVDTLGLSRFVPFERGLLGHERRAEPYTQPEHVRLALEELGTTFVKLGQVLSTRPDLLAPDFQAQLAKLQDDATPVPAQAIRDVLADELGGDADSAFAAFDVEPLAAASIGQAHAATLRDGTEVVVKIRRPGVVDQVLQDLELLQNLAVRASGRWEAAAGHDLVGLADEFAGTLRAELDYLQEGRNAERFAANFADDPDVRIPRVFWDTTTSRILTLERMRGIKVSDLPALDAAAIDRRALAERATRVIAQMVFEDGFFHADPHPGNFFIQPGGRIGMIDFGMVGTIDERLRDQLVGLLLALAREDPDRVAGALLTLGVSTGSVDRRLLRDDLAQLLARYSGRGIGAIALGPAISDVLGIVRRHHLRLPRDLALLSKMVVMEEGLAAQLDPQFRLGDVLGPYTKRLMAGQLSPAAVARRLGRAGIDVAQLTGELPEQLHRLLGVLESGGVEVHLRADELEPLLARVERLGDRLVAGVLAAAFVEGFAELLNAARSRDRRRPLVAFGAGAGALAAYAAWGAGRGRRRRSPAGGWVRQAP